MLSIENVSKTFFPGQVNEKIALTNVNCKLNHGDFVTVVGGNGAGKSTMLNCIAGVHIPEAGKITLEDQEITKNPEYSRANKIARVFQDPLMGTAASMTLEENLAMALKRGEKRGFTRAIKAANRDLFKERLAMLDLGLENRLKMDVGLLSGGQRQALTLLMATLVTPKLLLLDEHTAALDPKTSEMVLGLTEKIVSEKEITTMMITHSMDQALAYGNRLIMMSDGNIVVDVSGEEKEKLTVPDLLELFKKRSGQGMTEDAMLLG